MKERISGLAHCLHDNVHWEYCYDYDESVEYIKKNKLKNERKLHLRLLRIIPDDKLPGKDSYEWKVYVKAGEDYNKLWKVYVMAWNVLINAGEVYISKHQAELDKLHGELFPDCPWDGKTIFTRKNEKGEWY